MCQWLKSERPLSFDSWSDHFPGLYLKVGVRMPKRQFVLGHVRKKEWSLKTLRPPEGEYQIGHCISELFSFSRGGPRNVSLDLKAKIKDFFSLFPFLAWQMRKKENIVQKLLDRL